VRIMIHHFPVVQVIGLRARENGTPNKGGKSN
jgi:hypothetical protein